MNWYKNCNKAYQDAITKVRNMIEDENQWPVLYKRLKMCPNPENPKIQFNSMDISFLYFLIAMNIGMIAQSAKYQNCAYMTVECKKEPIDCLADILEIPFEEKTPCLPAFYSYLIMMSKKEEFDNKPVGRAWWWQACTEFGWFHTLDKVFSCRATLVLAMSIS